MGYLVGCGYYCGESTSCLISWQLSAVVALSLCHTLHHYIMIVRSCYDSYLKEINIGPSTK